MRLTLTCLNDSYIKGTSINLQRLFILPLIETCSSKFPFLHAVESNKHSASFASSSIDEWVGNSTYSSQEGKYTLWGVVALFSRSVRASSVYNYGLHELFTTIRARYHRCTQHAKAKKEYHHPVLKRLHSYLARWGPTPFWKQPGHITRNHRRREWIIKVLNWVPEYIALMTDILKDAWTRRHHCLLQLSQKSAWRKTWGWPSYREKSHDLTTVSPFYKNICRL